MAKKDRRLNAQNRDHAPGQVILEAAQFFVEFGTQVSQFGFSSPGVRFVR
jgi:hypothetical protein